MQDMSALFGTLTLALNTFHDKLSVELLTTTKLNNTCTTQLNSFGSILATESSTSVTFCCLHRIQRLSLIYTWENSLKRGVGLFHCLQRLPRSNYLQRPRSVIIYFVMCAYQSLLKSIEHNIQNNQRHPQFRILR